MDRKTKESDPDFEDGAQDYFFGEDSQTQVHLDHKANDLLLLQKKRLKEASIFKHINSWTLAHMIVKSGADLKEEQFTVQLIQQFDQIFKLENLDLLLTPYEIVSLGKQQAT